MRYPPSLLACKSSLDQRPLDDRRDVESGRQGAVRTAPLAAKTRGQERLGNGGMAMPDQARALQRQTDVFGDLPRAVLDGVDVAKLGLEPVNVSVEAAVMSGCLGEFVEQHVDAFGPSHHGAQRIQRADVAGAFPDAH